MRTPRLAALGAGALVAGAALVGTIVGASALDSAITGLCLFATVSLFALCLMIRGPAAEQLGLGALGLAPTIALLAMLSTERTLVSAFDFECGTGSVGLLVLIPAMAFGGVVVATLFSTWSPRGLATLGALMATGLGLASLVALGPRVAARAHRPTADGWVDSLPVRAELSPVAQATAGQIERADRVGPDRITRHCQGDGCTVALGDVEPAPEPMVNADASLRVLGTPNGRWLLLQSGSCTLALDRQTGLPARVTPASIGRSLSPDHGWLFCALLAAVLALLFVALALRSAARLMRLRQGRRCFVETGGGIRFLDSATPLHGVAACDVASGPGVAHGHGRRVLGAYREAALFEWNVEPGEPTQLRARTRSRLAALSYAACTLIWLGLTPLLIAARAGLL